MKAASVFGCSRCRALLLVVDFERVTIHQGYGRRPRIDDESAAGRAAYLYLSDAMKTHGERSPNCVGPKGVSVRAAMAVPAIGCNGSPADRCNKRGRARRNGSLERGGAS